MTRIHFRTFAVRQSVYAPGVRQPRHSHEYSNVSVVLAGHIEEATDAGHYCGKPYSVVLKAAGCEHENRVSGFGAKTLSIEFSALEPPAWCWFDDPPIVRAGIALHAAFERGDARDLECRAAELLEATIHAERSSDAAPAWLASLQHVLDEQYDRPLRFEGLAHDIGLHPVYVSRAFRRYTGMSMTEYVRAVRLRHARHALSSSRRSAGAIAAECGFTDPSHLSRTFSSLLGVTPRKYRQMSSAKV